MSGLRLSALDSAILQLETPTQVQNVLSVILIKEEDHRDLEELIAMTRERIAGRLPLLPFMARRLRHVPGLAVPVWEDVPDLNVEDHMHFARADEPGDMAALGRAVSEIARKPLARDRPLWEYWIVGGLADGLLAGVSKVHHSMIDGTSGIQSLAAFFDLEPNAAPMDVPPREFEPPLHGVELARESAGAAIRWTRRAVQAAPVAAKFLSRDATRTAADVATPFRAPRLATSGKLTSRRAIEFTDIELGRIKTIRRAFGCTFADVITAVMTGALREYLDGHGELPDQPLVGAVPVSERVMDDPAGGNRFSAMFYELPVHLPDPGDRVDAIVRTAAAAKTHYETYGQGALQSLASLVPPRTLGLGIRALGRLRDVTALPPPANVLISTIRGTDFPLYTVVGPIIRLFPMAPLIEGIGLNITAVSYLDAVGVSVQTCPDLMGDLDKFVGLIDLAVAELEDAAASRLPAS